jgi:uncharacterized protein YhhL (DUF1145 family)
LNSVLKAACLIVYALALVGLAGLLPAGLSGPVQTVAAILLLLHVLELLFFFKHVRKYTGPLAVSVLLTLLFGLLHWKPLADAAPGKAI